MSYPVQQMNQSKSLVEFLEGFNDVLRKARKMQMSEESCEVCIPETEQNKLNEVDYEVSSIRPYVANPSK